jgi:KDO2-lipid IV(A) lauroyltransferase
MRLLTVRQPRWGIEASAMRRNVLVDYTVYLIVRGFVTLISALRLETCQAWASWLATVSTRVLKIRAETVDENLRQAYPELSGSQRMRMAWRMWQHLFLMVAEVAHARRKIHPSNWHKHIHFRRDAEMARWLLDGRPMILVSGHYGNFELSGYFLGLFGFPTYTVARPLDNPFLHRFINSFRADTGQFLLPKNGSAAEIAELLARGRILAVLGDQHAGRSGCWVNFFRRLASTHKAIALFSLSSGAPLLVAYSRRLGKPLQYECGLQAVADPLDARFSGMSVPELTQWFTDQLEEIIRGAPEQYWWLHRRWKGEPSRRRPRKARSHGAKAA